MTARCWPVNRAWDAAVAVTAAAYDVAPEILRSESRGRGPRPPGNAWEAKKLAVYLAVLLAECAQVDLARTLGFHKSTISAHCDDVRNSDRLSALADELFNVAVARLDASGARRLRDRLSAERDRRRGAQIAQLEARIRSLEAKISSDNLPLHPTIDADHGIVIDFPRVAK